MDSGFIIVRAVLPLLALAVLAIAARQSVRFFLRRRRTPPLVERCKCGYALEQLSIARCPECGRVIGFDATAEQLGLTKEELQRAQAARLRRKAVAASPERPRYIESLETRRFLAGVTIITHGFEDNTTGWVSTMADAIANRAGGRSDVAIYTLEVGLDSNSNLAVLGLVHQHDTSTITTASSGETILKLDWSTVSDGTYSTVQVGDVVAAWLMATPAGLPSLDEMPIHLIGHSRGASLNTEIAKDLGEHDIWVDQFTSLDPHPVDGGSNNPFGADFGDEPMITWSNIVFADDYWRTNGNGQSTDPNGLPVTGAFVQSLAASVQANFSGSAHDSVHAWYFGTIDTHATTDSAGISIPSSWYGDSSALPPRDDTGFAYTLIGGGKRPASGLAIAHGGTAARIDPGERGTQWADVGDIALKSTSVAAGQSVKIQFNQQDRQSDSRVTFYLDTDKNPYNGNNVRVLASGTFSEANVVTAAHLKAGTSGVHAGKYYVYAKITAADGLIRYEYAPQMLTIT
jgi:hypothetical protein